MTEYFRLDTEIWEIETLEQRIIAPKLKNGQYRDVGLFIVETEYCKKT